eukprot:213563_1
MANHLKLDINSTKTDIEIQRINSKSTDKPQQYNQIDIIPESPKNNEEDIEAEELYTQSIKTKKGEINTKKGEIITTNNIKDDEDSDNDIKNENLYIKPNQKTTAGNDHNKDNDDGDGEGNEEDIEAEVLYTMDNKKTTMGNDV